MRLDGNLYEATMDALVSLYPKLSVGSYIIIDDNGQSGLVEKLSEASPRSVDLKIRWFSAMNIRQAT